MSDLRSALIRLAHANPQIRADLLTLVTAADFPPDTIGEVHAGGSAEGDKGSDAAKPWMKGEFSQQENSELLGKQEKGSLSDGKADKVASEFIKNYDDAYDKAREMADRSKLPVAIRAFKEYGRNPGFLVEYYSKNDGGMPEIIQPGAPRVHRGPRVAFPVIAKQAGGPRRHWVSGINRGVPWKLSFPTPQEALAFKRQMAEIESRMMQDDMEHNRQIEAGARQAGCEKLPEGPMRENCEKKKSEAKEASLRAKVIRLANDDKKVRPAILASKATSERAAASEASKAVRAAGHDTATSVEAARLASELWRSNKARA